MKYQIYLDDVRTPQTDGWEIVRSYDDFVKWIQENGLPDEVSFDHDLADEHYVQSINSSDGNTSYYDYNTIKEKTGYECCKYLVNECMKRGIKHPEFAVHSMNPVGARNIMDYVEQYNKDY